MYVCDDIGLARVRTCRRWHLEYGVCYTKTTYHSPISGCTLNAHFQYACLFIQQVCSFFLIVSIVRLLKFEARNLERCERMPNKI